jgi:hypothetical protein
VKNLSHGALSDRLRGAGAEVVVQGSEGKLMWTDLSHSERGRKRWQPDKLGDTAPIDLHFDCRARLEASAQEQAEVLNELQALQREHERLLRLMGTEREEYRATQKAHSDSQQLVHVLRCEVRDCKEELSSKERSRLHAESEECSLRAALLAAQEQRQQLEEALHAEEVAGRAALERMQETLNQEQRREHDAVESRMAASNRELLFAELEAQLATLSSECNAQREALREKSCELDAMATHDAMCTSSERQLRLELNQQRELYAAELSTALAEAHASEERCMERQEEMVREMTSGLRAERDEAQQQAATMLEHARASAEGAQKREDKAKNVLKTAETRANAAEKARKEAVTTQQAREKEMQEVQQKNAAAALKRETELVHTRSELDKAKSEIAELYDALLRSASERQPSKTNKR